MLEHQTYKSLCRAAATVIAVVVLGYTYGTAACVQECDNITEWCTHMGMASACEEETCFRAYAQETGSATETTCGPCGEADDEHEDNGWCSDGQEDWTCEDDPEEDTVWLKQFEDCQTDCSQVAGGQVVEASNLSNPTKLQRLERPRKVCAVVH